MQSCINLDDIEGAKKGQTCITIHMVISCPLVYSGQDNLLLLHFGNRRKN